MLTCNKHKQAVVSFEGDKCPVCCEAIWLWGKYEKDFKRARVAGRGRLMRKLKPEYRLRSPEELARILQE